MKQYFKQTEKKANTLLVIKLQQKHLLGNILTYTVPYYLTMYFLRHLAV